MTHKVPAPRRLRRVLHADIDMDVTTAIRFRSGEIASSMGLKVAVALFEVLLDGSAIILALPARADAMLRMRVVTPNMPRVRRSAHRDERDADYGFAVSVSVWDRR